MTGDEHTRLPHALYKELLNGSPLTLRTKAAETWMKKCPRSHMVTKSHLCPPTEVHVFNLIISFSSTLVLREYAKLIRPSSWLSCQASIWARRRQTLSETESGSSWASLQAWLTRVCANASRRAPDVSSSLWMLLKGASTFDLTALLSAPHHRPLVVFCGNFCNNYHKYFTGFCPTSPLLLLLNRIRLMSPEMWRGAAGEWQTFVNCAFLSTNIQRRRQRGKQPNICSLWGGSYWTYLEAKKAEFDLEGESRSAFRRHTCTHYLFHTNLFTF